MTTSQHVISMSPKNYKTRITTFLDSQNQIQFGECGLFKKSACKEKKYISNQRGEEFETPRWPDKKSGNKWNYCRTAYPSNRQCQEPERKDSEDESKTDKQTMTKNHTNDS